MARRAQLVCQFLENISREVLRKHQAIVQDYVRGRNGIYALYRKGKLYYVGLATNLRSRLHMHLIDKHRKLWDRFSVYLTIGDRHLRELEAMLLRIVRPAGNKQKSKFAKADNLRRKLASDVRKVQRLELNELIGRTCKPMREGQRLALRQGKGRKLPLAPYASLVKSLRVRYKGKLIKATVLRDGTIKYKGRRYLTPTMAAKAVLHYGAVNGWQFWTYQRAPGDWVPIAYLRT